MRVTFYDCGYETFGVQYLISVLKKEGHEVSLFFDSSFLMDYLAHDFFLSKTLSLSAKEVCDLILAKEPQVVCFSVYTIYYQRNMAVIRELKEARPDLVVVCGGFHPSLLPEVALSNPEVDFIIVGEGEFSLSSLLRVLDEMGRTKTKALSSDGLQGVWNLHNGKMIERGLSMVVKDLDSLPLPDKDLYYSYNPSLKKLYTIIASRGCPYFCTYCNSATMNSFYLSNRQRYYRVRSVDNVIAELRVAKERYRPSQVMFFDDVFASNLSWLREFNQHYKKQIGLPFFCQTSPLIHNEESLDLLADSGCVLLEFGFQSANPEVRERILNRKETNEEMRNLILLAKKKKIFTELDLIMNLPNETEEHIRQSLDFVLETRPHWVNVAYLQFHPKTPITRVALEAGMLKPADVEAIEQGKYASSMRLLSDTRLGDVYRLLPFQMFFASKLPGWLARVLIGWTRTNVVGKVCSLFASTFLYASRILSSFTDRRDFLVRHHVVRSLFAARWVLGRKVFGCERQ